MVAKLCRRAAQGPPEPTDAHRPEQAPPRDPRTSKHLRGLPCNAALFPFPCQARFLHAVGQFASNTPPEKISLRNFERNAEHIERTFRKKFRTIRKETRKGKSERHSKRNFERNSERNSEYLLKGIRKEIAKEDVHTHVLPCPRVPKTCTRLP